MRSTMRSVACVAGAVASTIALLLGFIWPSYLTILAIPILPAPFIFAIERDVPERKRSSARVIYLVVSGILAVVIIAVEMLWLVHVYTTPTL